MSVVMTDDMKDEIKDIFAKQGMGTRVYLFDKIPSNKFRNATNSFAPNIHNSETVIALYDHSIFGSSNTGFILTTQRLYRKNTAGSSTFIEIKNISHMNFQPGSFSRLAEAHVIAINGDVLVKQLSAGGKAKELFNALKETIYLLQNPESFTRRVKPQATSSTSSRQCNGCGAVGTTSICEYCGGPL